MAAILENERRPGLANSSSGLGLGRSGYLPISVLQTPPAALAGLCVFLRGSRLSSDASAFTPVRDANTPFTDGDRERLLAAGVDFVYIRAADRPRFREQLEAELPGLVVDPKVSGWTKATVVYETAMDLADELVCDPGLAAKGPRIERIGRAVSVMVLRNPDIFPYLFDVSSHDSYTATHLVNVGMWMVPLAHAAGLEDEGTLAQVFVAGMLHDIGKTLIPSAIINKSGKLTDQEWATVRTHPQRGADYLQTWQAAPPLAVAVALQHHERMDGTGYPAGLKHDQIEHMSRICAVVDSFDAMTAFRPYKERTFSVLEALTVLTRESPGKYDRDIVAVWRRLLDGVPPAGSGPGPATGSAVRDPSSAERRRDLRFRFRCPAVVNVMERERDVWVQKETVQVITHNLSRTGLCFLSPAPIRPGSFLRVYLRVQKSDRRIL